MCHELDALEALYTDFWNPLPPTADSLYSLIGGSAGARMAGRRLRDIPNRLVRSYPISTITWQMRFRGISDRTEIYKKRREWGSEFARRVARDISEKEFSIFFGYSTASLEAMVEAKRRGAITILDVTGPHHLEEKIIAGERKRFPSLENVSQPIETDFLNRVEDEWSVADRIMVNSRWTADALGERGVPKSKIHIVPLTYDRLNLNAIGKRTPRNQPWKVLWLGTLNLRKGLPYAVEAARMLIEEDIEFTFAGPSELSNEQIDWPINATVLGQIPRTKVQSLWDSHHLFLLPTLSDGFAITQIEALANGLPIIVTRNCARVVEDGVSGAVIDDRSPASIVQAVMKFVSSEIDYERASSAALERSKHFGSESVKPKLARVLGLTDK